MTRDHRDLVIEHLVDSEAALLDQIVALTAERDAFRALAQEALHYIRNLHAAHQRLRAEFRACRAATISGGPA